MITANEHIKTVRGNLSGEKVAMGIEEEHLGLVMDTLAGMYSDQKMALLREYGCNARDAMVAAGRGDHPIEVTLPGDLSPFLTIKDTGIGMDIEDIRRTYSRYGASTKRDTNAQVGKFGIGSKAAMAYTDQFTLCAVKNGIRIQVAISRTANSGGDMTIVDERPTSDPNGVEIVIPCKHGDSGAFREKAKYFFSFWERGMVLVDGEEPTPFTEGAIPIPNMDAWVVRCGAGGVGDVVIMGNVPYPASLSQGTLPSHSLVVRVPIGAVDIPPARESLKQSPETDAMLAKLRAAYKANVGKAVQAQIDKAATKRDAMMARECWSTVLGGKTGDAYTWCGTVMPYNLRAFGAVSCGSHGNNALVDPKCSNCKEAEPDFFTFGTQSRDWTSFMACRDMPLSTIDHELRGDRAPYWVKNSKYLLVEGYDRGNKPTATVKKKMVQYIIDNGLVDEGYTDVIMFRELHQRNADALTWIKPIKRIKWADVWATKLARETKITNSGRPTGSYPVAQPPPKDYVPHAWYIKRGQSGMLQGVTWKDVPANELPSRPIYVTSSRDDAMRMALQCNEPVVFLTTSRVDKFKRENPNARQAVPVAKARLEAYVKTLSNDEKVLMSHIGRWGGYGNPFYGWGGLDGQAVDDPDVLELVRLGRLNVKDKLLKLQDMGGYATDIKPDTPFEDPRHKYPLLDSVIGKEDVDHAVLYINAAYAAQAKGA